MSDRRKRENVSAKVKPEVSIGVLDNALVTPAFEVRLDGRPAVVCLGGSIQMALGATPEDYCAAIKAIK